MRTISVKVIVPDEYDDVADELAFADFIANPSAWEIELIKEPQPKTIKEN